MTYRVYLRTPNQRVHPDTRTVTEDPFVAEAAFRALMRRREFWCLKMAAVLTEDGIQIEYRRFDSVKIVGKYGRVQERGGHIPDWPRWLYPHDRNNPDHPEPEADSKYLPCYLEREKSTTLILDDRPILLTSHDT